MQKLHMLKILQAPWRWLTDKAETCRSNNQLIKIKKNLHNKLMLKSIFYQMYLNNVCVEYSNGLASKTIYSQNLLSR